MRYWKTTQGIDRAPVMEGSPSACVTREQWELAVDSETPMPLEWALPWDGQLVDVGLLLPVTYDPAALDAFTERGGAGLWPIEPMTEDEIALVRERGEGFVELQSIMFATLQTEKAHPAF